MDPEAIKPAGLPATEALASPPPAQADPLLAANSPQTETPALPQAAPEAKAKTQQPIKENKVKGGHSVGLAIFATVIIVLGIAALAVYAYLKQH